jgi:hypothetical protein
MKTFDLELKRQQKLQEDNEAARVKRVAAEAKELEEETKNRENLNR